MSRDRLRNHTTMLFDFEQQEFQVNTFIKPGVQKKIKRAVILNDRTHTHIYVCVCVCVLNSRHSNVYVHMLLYVVLRIT